MATVKLIDAFSKKFRTNLPILVLQLHDELIFEISKNQKDEVEKLMNDILPLPNVLSVKFEIKIKSGLAWSALGS